MRRIDSLSRYVINSQTYSKATVLNWNFFRTSKFLLKRKEERKKEVCARRKPLPSRERKKVVRNSIYGAIKKYIGIVNQIFLNTTTFHVRRLWHLQLISTLRVPNMLHKFTSSWYRWIFIVDPTYSYLVSFQRPPPPRRRVGYDPQERRAHYKTLDAEWEDKCW